MKASSRRSGFTLLELSVVTAIGGIMIAILLPAIQKARSAARNSGCANNMRKIGLALHGYVSTYGSFPSGVNNPDERPTQGWSPFGYHPWWSWMALTTQFYEGHDVYKMADDHAKSGGNNWWPWGSPPNQNHQNPVLGIQLQIWICPSDDPTRYTKYTGGGGLHVAFTSYLGVSGIKDEDTAPRSMAGLPAKIGAPKGVLFLLSKIRPSDIKDGTSHTVIVGERPPSADLVWGWWFAGAGFPGPNVSYYTGRATGNPKGWSSFSQKGTGDVFLGAREDAFWNWLRKQPEGQDDPTCTGPMKTGLQPGSLRGYCDQAHFWSLHPGGANFLLANGSVRFLSYRQDNIFPQLCTRTGGELAPLP